MRDLPDPFVDARWLRAELGAPDLVLLDVRWALPHGADPTGYRRGHLPGARFVDLDAELAGTPGPRGRHPLPEPARFAAAMRRTGVRRQGRVVAYDQGSGAAARAWWLLRSAGHPWVRVLDGGLAGWTGGGGALDEGEGGGPEGDFQASGFDGWVPAETVAELAAAGAGVLDARTPERFAGEPFPLDPRPGHVPGARNLPWTDAYREGRVIGREEITARVAEAGGRPAAVYCGSGVTACALILALEHAGIGAVQLYPGSWSEWAQDLERPVELSG